MDLFVVPTIGFELLYAFVIVRLDCTHMLDSMSQKSYGRMGCTSDLGMRPPNISSVIGTKPTVGLSRPVDCAPWAFGTRYCTGFTLAARGSPNG